MGNEPTVYGPPASGQDGFLLTPDAAAARIRWAYRHGHPDYLWPDVRPQDWRSALLDIERVTAAILGGHAGTVLAVPHEADQRALGVAAFTSGMGPLLGWWAGRGDLRADPNTHALLAVHLEHGRARAHRMERALRDTVRTLENVDIPVTVLKGAHTARVYFPEPGLRPMSDLDVLVAPAHVARAEAALAAAGYVAIPGHRLARPYRSNWFVPGGPTALRSLVVQHVDNPFTIDLHDALDLPFFGVHTIRLELPVSAPRLDAPWAGARVTTLPHPLLVVHHAAHASRGLNNLTLLRIVELVLILRRDAQAACHWQDLAALLRRQHAERFVYPAFALVERLVPGTVDPAFLVSLEHAATPRLRAIVSGLTPATAQRLERRRLSDSFMWAGTPAEHVRSGLDLLFPVGRSTGPLQLGRMYLRRLYRIFKGGVSFR